MLKKNCAAWSRVAKMLYTVVLVTMTLASVVGAWGLFKESLRAKS